MPKSSTVSDSAATDAKPNDSIIMASTQSRVLAAVLAVFPLSISVIPWGILCGTLSVEAGMSTFQAQLMSLIVFGGAAQLAGIAILGTSSSWMSLVNSTTMISVRHVLYCATYKETVIQLPWLKRVLFAFLLTDEMFLVAQAHQIKTGHFDYWYSIVAGFTFYVVWNLSTFIGIVSAKLLTNIDALGFDFAIVATFIAMVIPMITNKILAVAVLVSAFSAYLFASYDISNGLIFSALSGMLVGAWLSTLDDRDEIITDISVVEDTPDTCVNDNDARGHDARNHSKNTREKRSEYAYKDKDKWESDKQINSKKQDTEDSV